MHGTDLFQQAKTVQKRDLHRARHADDAGGIAGISQVKAKPLPAAPERNMDAPGLRPPPRQNGCPPGKTPGKRLLDQARWATATGLDS